MRFTKRGVATTAGLLTLLGVLAIPPETETSEEMVPVAHGDDDADVTRGDFLQVYSVNWENLPEAHWLEDPPDPPPGNQCAGDWRDLLHYMRFGPGPEHGGPDPKYTPDVLLVQQIDDPSELDFLVREMTDKLDGRYASVIANRKKNEKIEKCYTRNEHGHQVEEKDEQTNAIIYRTGRFEKVAQWGWQSAVCKADDCEYNDPRCENNTQDRTRNVAVRLRDKLYGPWYRSYHVTAASIHWATKKSGGRWCTEKNWAEAVEEMNEPADDELRILGGDFNIHDSKTKGRSDWWEWYDNANGDLHDDVYDETEYRDVIYQHCTEPGKALTACLDNNWTHKYRAPDRTRRIDFLFAQADGGVDSIDLPDVHAEHTVTFNEGDSADRHVGDPDNEELSYSQHRAIRARIHYPF